MVAANYVFEIARDAIATRERGRVALHFLNDRETPVLVEVRLGEGRYACHDTGTWLCTTCEGVCGSVPLTREEIQWLNSYADRVEAWTDRILG